MRATGEGPARRGERGRAAAAEDWGRRPAAACWLGSDSGSGLSRRFNCVSVKLSPPDTPTAYSAGVGAGGFLSLFASR